MRTGASSSSTISELRSSKKNELIDSRETKSPGLASGAYVSFETASFLEMETQTALELMESKVGAGSGVAEKCPALKAHRRKRSRLARGAKIGIQIGKIQPPMLVQANIDTAAGRPSSSNTPVSSKNEIFIGRVVRRR